MQSALANTRSVTSEAVEHIALDGVIPDNNETELQSALANTRSVNSEAV